MKVATIVGTRPEIIRLSRVMSALDKCAEHILIHTGQNYDYELNEIFFADLSLRAPDRYLEAAGHTASETIGNVVMKADQVLRHESPDAVLVLGDTNSCMAAIAAKKLKIPIFHMEAGNRCFDQRVPEETNRRIVDHIADVNLPYSAIAREYLLREGLPPDRIIRTGSPMREVLEFYGSKIDASTILASLEVKKREYLLVSVHREENVDAPEQLRRFGDLLDKLVADWGLPVIVSTHPRTRKRLDKEKRKFPQLVRFCKPFGFTDYVRLQCDAKVTLSDSGTITEEASILGFPAINLREAHERPEGMEEAAVMMTGLDPSTVCDALKVLFSFEPGADCYKLSRVYDYQPSNVSRKVCQIIRSYISYANAKTWGK